MTSSCTSMASEVFQWNGADVSNEGKQEKIKEELADVVNYCVLMADACGLDLDEIVWEKIKVNAKKYPVEKAKGMSRGKEVKELREKMGMNRREFSDYYGIPYRTVQDWEAEKRELPEYLLRLMKYRAEVEYMVKNKS